MQVSKVFCVLLIGMFGCALTGCDEEAFRRDHPEEAAALEAIEQVAEAEVDIYLHLPQGATHRLVEIAEA